MIGNNGKFSEKVLKTMKDWCLYLTCYTSRGQKIVHSNDDKVRENLVSNKWMKPNSKVLVKHFEDTKTDNRRTRNQAWLMLTSYFDSKRNFGQFYVLFVFFWCFFFPFCSIDGIRKDRKTDQQNNHQNIVQIATAFRCWFFKQSFNRCSA